MRKVHYDVRHPTLDELDASVARAKQDMDAWREAGAHDLAAVCEQAMNRFLDARAKQIEPASSSL